MADFFEHVKVALNGPLLLLIALLVSAVCISAWDVSLPQALLCAAIPVACIWVMSSSRSWPTITLRACALCGMGAMLLYHGTNVAAWLAVAALANLACLTLQIPALAEPLPVIPALVIFAIFLIGDTDTRDAVGLAFGRMDGGPLAWALICVAISSAALVWWSVCLVDGDHGHIQEVLGPMLSRVSIVPMALLNALAEEIDCRMLLLGALWAGKASTNTSWVSLAIVLHSVFFALQHVMGGFPSGAIGGLLVFIWSVFLGILRWWSGGMALVYILHVQADIVIFALVLRKKWIIESRVAQELKAEFRAQT